jgi:UDP-glucose 4-epimerase
MNPIVLVTGASGFVGRGVVPALVKAGYEVRAAARRTAVIPSVSGVTAVAMPDLGAPDVDWRPLVDGASHVVHLAGLAHMTASIPEASYTAVNATATERLAIAVRDAGVRRLVLVSSVRAQVGPVSSAVVRESDPPAPTDAYGRSKLAAEKLLWAALAGSPSVGVVLRPVLVYGPGVKGNMAALARLAHLPVPLPLGALSNRRSLIGLGNLASAIAHALGSPKAAGGTFLAADAEPVGVADILRHLRHGLGRAPGLVPLPLAPFGKALRMIGRGAVWDRIAGDLVVDTSALRVTGWQPPHETAEGLAAMMR